MSDRLLLVFDPGGGFVGAKWLGSFDSERPDMGISRPDGFALKPGEWAAVIEPERLWLATVKLQ